jgi:DNA-binding response OmpR family regulator
MVEGNSPRLLVVEDEPDTAKAIKRLLERRLGASVDVAVDGSEARECILSTDYDLITLDFQLPDCDGLDLLKELREMRNAPPVVMVTGHGDNHVAEKAFDLGVAAYVLKDERMLETLASSARRALSEA